MVSALFLASAKRVGMSDRKCWKWAGHSDRDGYGRVKDGGRNKLAHRCIWELCRGEIPEMMTVDHTCKERSCVNPAHLRLLSWEENCGPTRFGARQWWAMAGYVHKAELRRKPTPESDGEPF